MTHRLSSAPSILAEIAKLAPTLTKLLKDHPEDLITADLTISTLAHTVGYLTRIGNTITPAGQAVLDSLDLAVIILRVTKAVRRLGASANLIDHATQLIVATTKKYAEACKAYSPTLRLLVAGLRSKDWRFRSVCISGILDYHHPRFLSPAQDFTFGLPKSFLDRVLEGLPPDIALVVNSYGLDRCERFIAATVSVDLHSAISQCVQDKDLYSLGIKMTSFITTSFRSVPTGYFHHPSTNAPLDLGLPFRTWQELLTHGADAIRKRNKSNETYLAEILETEFQIKQRSIDHALELAGNGIELNPHCSYFYYVVSRFADHSPALRAAKKGLQCRETTPYLRFELLGWAVHHASFLGLGILRSPGLNQIRFDEGITLLHSALQDAKTYIAEAPPDSLHMRSVFNWLLILSIFVEGPAMSEDLHELEVSFSFWITVLLLRFECLSQSSLRKLKIHRRIMATFFIRPPAIGDATLGLAQEYIIGVYPKAVKEWGDVIVQRDKDAKTDVLAVVPQAENIRDDLSAWLEKSEDPPPTDCGKSKSRPLVYCEHRLYKCAWCKNPSAALRKCSGCVTER